MARLGEQWRVLHAVPVGRRGSDIDHVLIGPPGVMTVNTKHHRGQPVWVAGTTVMVAGHRHPYLRNSVHEAARAERLLSAACGVPVPVRPLLVVVNPRSLTIKKRPEGVDVVSSAALPRHLGRLPVVLEPAQVEQIAAVAARPSTWQATTSAELDPARARQRFDELHRQVRGAARVRRAWTAVLAVGAIVAVAVYGQPLITAVLTGLLRLG